VVSTPESAPCGIAFTATQRRKVALLVGTPWGVSRRPVRLKDLADALGGHGLTVREFPRALDGAGMGEAAAHAWPDAPGALWPGHDELRALAKQTVQVVHRPARRALPPCDWLTGAAREQ